MKYVSHVFQCDAPGCVSEAARRGISLSNALKSIRRDGWTVRKGQHFCPQHEPGGAS